MVLSHAPVPVRLRPQHHDYSHRVTPLEIAPDVAASLAAGHPVVGLESAVFTHGLPAAAAREALRRQWQACQEHDGTPAVVAVYEGRLRVGLTPAQTDALIDHHGSVKVSPWNLAAALHRPGFGGTTVAATLVACATAGITMMSTGGIGGVHPGEGEDVSADLLELSRRRVGVVCAGPKSVLDARRTLERLETLGVPVIGWRSDRLAGFYQSLTELPVAARADTVADLAAILRDHWSLGGYGLLVTQPLPEEVALPAQEMTAALAGLDSEAGSGWNVTPTQLAGLLDRLGPQMIDANLALLGRNASLAARLAVELTR
jgi:pseudouridylate synthase